MKERLICLLALCCLAQWSIAQTPKWVEKAKRAVISIVTYDQDDKILNTGNGFFVTEDGVAVSDYTLFEGAQRAVVLDAEGKQMSVACIMGTDDMYDIIKFKVDIPGKKVMSLPVVTASPVAGAEVYLLPYSTKKSRFCITGKVNAVDKVAAGNDYYTLGMQLQPKMVSCPVATAEGEVFGIVQPSSGADTASICYAVDIRYAMSLEITALSYSDMSLRSIGIKKALPNTEEQAMAFLFMVSGQVTPEKYRELLDDFVAQFPESADGYIRRAGYRLQQGADEASLTAVEADLDKALEVADAKDDVYYNRAKLIYSYLLQQPDKPYKDWSYDKALEEVREAIAVNPLPVYVQMEGDIQFARQDYPAALACYEQVNRSNLASAATFFCAARTKELMKAPAEEILALMDSCVTRFTPPYTEQAAPYLLARAQVRANVGKAREALRDYDDYFNAVNGQVNDLFYYYREQVALQGKQYQRALDDINKAIELKPEDLIYKAELAVINIRVGRSEEALSVLQEALAIDPDYSEAYRLMGLAHLQLKQREKACDCFAKAKALGDPNVDALIEKHCK